MPGRPRSTPRAERGQRRHTGTRVIASPRVSCLQRLPILRTLKRFTSSIPGIVLTPSRFSVFCSRLSSARGPRCEQAGRTSRRYAEWRGHCPRRERKGGGQSSSSVEHLAVSRYGGEGFLSYPLWWSCARPSFCVSRNPSRPSSPVLAAERACPCSCRHPPRGPPMALLYSPWRRCAVARLNFQVQANRGAALKPFLDLRRKLLLSPAAAWGND
jgi:hypothetical protein